MKVEKMIKENKNKQKESKKKPFETEQLLHPEGANAYFSNYFSVEVSQDNLILGFGQKLPLEKDNKKLFELRRRIVMTIRGAKIFYNLLGDSLKNLQKSSKKTKK